MNPVLLDLPSGLEDLEKEEVGDVLDEEEDGEEEGAIVQDPADVKEAEPRLLKVGECGTRKIGTACHTPHSFRFCTL